jgi:lambda repressor-like predicted transcriptional regulator
MTPITLPKHLEDWARAEVAAGRSQSIDALVAETLEARRASADLRGLLDHARAQAAQGLTTPAADVVADLRRRAAALRALSEVDG